MSDPSSSPVVDSSLIYAEYQLSAQKDYYQRILQTIKQKTEETVRLKDSQLAAAEATLRAKEAEFADYRRSSLADRDARLAAARAASEKKTAEFLTREAEKDAEIDALKRELARDRDRHAESLVAERGRASECYQAMQKEMQNKIQQLQQQLTAMEASYEEALHQQEKEQMDLTHQLRRETKKEIQKQRESTAILYAEMAAAKRKLEESSNVKSAFELTLAEREDHSRQLSALVKRLSEEIMEQRKMNRAKEEEITRQQYDLVQARQDNSTLKNFIEILEHRIAELEEREKPALRVIQNQKGRAEEMYEEFFQLNKQKVAAEDLQARKSSEAQRLAATVNQLRHKMAKKDQIFELIRKELKFIVEHVGTGGAANQERIHSEMQRIYKEYFTNYRKKPKRLQNKTSEEGGNTADNGAEQAGEQSSEASEDELSQRLEQIQISQEVDRQRKYLEKSLVSMQKYSGNLAQRRKQESEQSLTHNLKFLHEVNRLRYENKRLEQRCGGLKSICVRAGLGDKIKQLEAAQQPFAEKKQNADNPTTKESHQVEIMPSRQIRRELMEEIDGKSDQLTIGKLESGSPSKSVTAKLEAQTEEILRLRASLDAAKSIAIEKVTELNRTAKERDELKAKLAAEYERQIAAEEKIDVKPRSPESEQETQNKQIVKPKVKFQRQPQSTPIRRHLAPSASEPAIETIASSSSQPFQFPSRTKSNKLAPLNHSASLKYLP